MLIFASTQENFDHWKARLFDQDEAVCVEATAGLVEVANKSKEFRRECTNLIAARLEQLIREGFDVYFTLKAVSDFSRGIISSSEPLMRALMRLPIKDSYALNMAMSILLYEMSQGFIKPDHVLEKPLLAMAAQISSACKGDARRYALRILELAETHSRWQPDFRGA